MLRKVNEATIKNLTVNVLKSELSKQGLTLNGEKEDLSK